MTDEKSPSSAEPPLGSTPPKKERPIFGWFKDKLAAQLVMLVIGTILGSWWNSSVPYLRYSVGEVNQFASEKEEFGLFYVRITNDGRKQVENVQCEIELGESLIEDLKAGPSILAPTVKIDADGRRALITFPSLNRSEVLELTIKASKPNQILKERRISVRGRDVVGVEGTRPDYGWLQIPMIFAAFAVYGLLLGPVMFKCFDLISELNRKLKQKLDAKKAKRFRITTGELDGQFVTGEEANTIFDSITMKGTRVDYLGVTYKVGDRKVDDDGTVEHMLSEYYW